MKNSTVNGIRQSIENYDAEALKTFINKGNANEKIFKIFEDDKKPLLTPLIKISLLKRKRREDDRYNGIPITKSESDDVQLASVVLETGANIDEQDRNGNTALHYCVYSQNAELLKFLLEKGANPNIQDNNGNTPLLLDVKGNKKFTDELVSAGADKTIKNFNGEDFLYIDSYIPNYSL